jgi:hypothetical protein
MHGLKPCYLCCAGAIKWSRSLFARVKQTMSRLDEVQLDEAVRQSEVGLRLGTSCLPCCLS